MVSSQSSFNTTTQTTRKRTTKKSVSEVQQKKYYAREANGIFPPREGDVLSILKHPRSQRIKFRQRGAYVYAPLSYTRLCLAAF